MKHKLEDVFGIRTEPVLSYVNREVVDGRFQEGLASSHHIIVYGSSKQGKTALRQTHLPDKDCLIVRCSPTMNPESIYMSIVRQLDLRMTTMETKKEGATGKVSTKIGFKAMLPFIGSGKSEVAAEVAGTTGRETTSEFVAYDYGEAQSIGELLTRVKFKKKIVLENFHYLHQDVQRQLAFDLKTFHEIGITFVILGIWREADLLITYNHDLQDRLIDVPVEPWEAVDFDRLIAEGSDRLKVKIDMGIREIFRANAYGNVGMLQEFLKTFCKLSGVTETGAERVLDSAEIAKRTVEHRLKNQRAQLVKDLQRISAQSRIRGDEPDPLLLPYYLVQVILGLKIEELENGIERKRLLELLRSIHHRVDKETIRGSDLVYLLQRLPIYQRDMQPPFVYYDSNNQRLKIVDTRQFFGLS